MFLLPSLKALLVLDFFLLIIGSGKYPFPALLLSGKKSFQLKLVLSIEICYGYDSNMYCYSCDSVESCNERNLTAVKCEYTTCQKSINYLNTYFIGVPTTVQSWYYDCIRFSMVLSEYYYFYYRVFCSVLKKENVTFPISFKILFCIHFLKRNNNS